MQQSQPPLSGAEPERAFKQTLRQIDRLRPEERSQALQALVGCMLAGLNTAQVGAVRAELVKEFGSTGEFIVLLDGDLALQEIQALADE
jgi:hypothetical protein